MFRIIFFLLKFLKIIEMFLNIKIWIEKNKSINLK